MAPRKQSRCRLKFSRRGWKSPEADHTFAFRGRLPLRPPGTEVVMASALLSWRDACACRVYIHESAGRNAVQPSASFFHPALTVRSQQASRTRRRLHSRGTEAPWGLRRCSFRCADPQRLTDTTTPMHSTQPMAPKGALSSGSSRAFCVNIRLGGHPMLSLMGDRTTVLGMLAASCFAWYDCSLQRSTTWEKS